MTGSLQESMLWDASPFDHELGSFWDPRFPEDRYAGTYFTHMDLPFVEIAVAERPSRDWGLQSLAGDLADGREVLLLGHAEGNYAAEVAREDHQRYNRYSGIGALIGTGAASITDDTLLRHGTLRGQNIARWMGATSLGPVLIGTGFMPDSEIPKVTATVEGESRMLAVNLGVGIPLRRALTLLDHALYLGRKAIGCMSGVHTVARAQTVRTDSGETFLWRYAEWEAPLREPIRRNVSVPLQSCGPTDSILNRFQTAKESLWPVADVLYVNLASVGLYSEHRFVSLIAALEGIHTQLEGISEDKRWTDDKEDEFEAAHSALDKHLTGTVDKNLKKMMLDMFQNRRTLNQKLDDIFGLVGADVEAQLRIKRNIWKRLATSDRNKTAHEATTSTSQSDIAKDAAKYRALSVVTEELLRQILLMAMHVDEEVRKSSAFLAASNLRGSGFREFLAD